MRLLLALLLLGLAAPAWALTLTGAVRWEGTLRFAESVRVEPGATLTVAPGTRVVFAAGGLEVAGTLAARDCRFEGEGWAGLSLKGSGEETRLSGVTVRGAQTGIFVGGGAPRLENLVLVENEVGMEIKQKSRARVDGCRFERNRKVGLFVKDDSTPRVTGCTFVGNGRFGAYLHRSTPEAFSGHRFEGNATGLAISHYGSAPRVSDSLFAGNTLGVLVDRAATPVLTGNRWEKNAVALKLHRRSDARVEGNLFRDNTLAVLVSYSSYPHIAGNDFAGNATALRLEFQSAQWEEQRGAAARADEVARQGAFGGQHAPQVDEEQRRARSLDGTVDARDNWWGEAGNRELERIGAAGNPTFIDDGRDRPQFEEGGANFPLDTVVFAPWRRRPALGEKP